MEPSYLNWFVYNSEVERYELKGLHIGNFKSQHEVCLIVQESQLEIDNRARGFILLKHCIACSVVESIKHK